MPSYRHIAPVVAPKPCQTSSLKSESAIPLFWTPSTTTAGTNKWRNTNWASDDESDDNDDDNNNNDNIVEETKEMEAPPTPSLAREEDDKKEKTMKGTALKEKSYQQPPLIMRVMKRPPGSSTNINNEVMESNQQHGVTNQIVDIATVTDTDEDKSIEHEPEVLPIPIAPAWVTEEENEDDLDDAEREKRRRERAMAQQQLVLQQVAAARAKNKQKSLHHEKKILMDKKPREKQQLLHNEKNQHTLQKSVETQSSQKRLNSKPTENEKVREERLRHQAERQPRTKGFLYARLATGLLVRVDRHGEELPKEVVTMDAHDDNDDNVDEEDSVEETSETTPQPEVVAKKVFVPAPVPAVSAWIRGPPPSIKTAQPPLNTTQEVKLEEVKDLGTTNTKVKKHPNTSRSYRNGGGTSFNRKPRKQQIAASTS